MSLLPLIVLGHALLAATPAEDFASRDGVFVTAAAVPQAGDVRFTTGGGAVPTNDPAQGNGQLGMTALWTFLPDFAAGVEASNEAGKVTPAVSLRWQFLSQASAPLDASALVRFKSVGFEKDESEVEASANFGRTFGRLLLVANGVIGKGLGEEGALDVEARTGAGWRFSDVFQLAVEGRFRTEVALEEEAPAPDKGREYDALAGPTASFHVSDFYMQLMAGYGVPRGNLNAGPVALAFVSFDL